MLKSVYLAGPIFQCSDDECVGWREQAKHRLSGLFRILDPMVRDCRGMEESLASDIVSSDLADIESVDILLVNVSAPSWGTAMEVFHASRTGKAVFGFGALPGKVSPWLRTHTLALYGTLAEACEAIKHSEVITARL